MSTLFDVKLHDSDDEDTKEETNAQICGICKKQVSKYTCPRCNVKYCSLSCYKNEIHSNCTESFYKDNVLEEIKSQRVDDDQKQKMLDMLKKFEKENDEMATEKLELEDDEDITDDITERFKDMDLDSADFETIWNKLTQAERNEFEQKYIKGKPENFLELSDELLLWKPWWETTAEYNNRKKEILSSKISELNDDYDYDSDDSGGKIANRPPILKDIKNLEDLTKTSPNPAISLNLLNILYAYAYTCRTFNGDIFENPEESCKVLWDLSPILATNENLVYENVSQAIASGSSLTVQNPIYSQPHEFSYLILDDIVNLFTSANNVLAALSDLYRLFQQVEKTTKSNNSSKRGKINQKAFLTGKKVYFYIVYINYLSQQLGSSFLDALREGVELERQELLKEIKDYKKDQKNIKFFMKNEKDNDEQDHHASLIEEI